MVVKSPKTNPKESLKERFEIFILLNLASHHAKKTQNSYCRGLVTWLGLKPRC